MAPGLKFGNAKIGDVAFEFVLDELGRRQLRERDFHILRLGLAAADHGELHDRSRIAAEQKLRLLDGHLPGGKAGDFFEHVAQSAGRLSGRGYPAARKSR